MRLVLLLLTKGVQWVKGCRYLRWIDETNCMPCLDQTSSLPNHSEVIT